MNILLLICLLLCEFSQEINGAGFPPAPPPPHKREEIRALFNRAIDLEDDYPDGFKDNDTKREAASLATNSGATTTTSSSLDPVAAFEQLYNPGAGGKDVDMPEIGTTLVPATSNPTTKAATTVKETLVLMAAAPEEKGLAKQTVDSTQASVSSESSILPDSIESAIATQLTTEAPMTSTLSTEVPTAGVSSLIPNSELKSSPVGLPDGFEPDGAFDKIDESKNNSVLIIPTQSENDVVVVDVEDITQIDTVPVESYSNGGKSEDSNVQVSAISGVSVASTMLPSAATSEMTTSKEPGEILSFSTIPVPLDDGSTVVSMVTTPVVATQSTGSPNTNVPTAIQSTTTYAPDPTSRIITATQQPGPTRSFVVASGAIHRRTFFRPSEIGTSGNSSPIIKTGVHLEEPEVYANQGTSDSDNQYANQLGYDNQESHMSQHRYEATLRSSTKQTTPEPITIGYRKRKQILIDSQEIDFQGSNVERQESEGQGSQAFQPASNFKPEIAQLLLNNGKNGNLIPVLKTVLRPSVSHVNGHPKVSFRKVHYVVFKEAPLKA